MSLMVRSICLPNGALQYRPHEAVVKKLSVPTYRNLLGVKVPALNFGSNFTTNFEHGRRMP